MEKLKNFSFDSMRELMIAISAMEEDGGIASVLSQFSITRAIYNMKRGAEKIGI